MMYSHMLIASLKILDTEVLPRLSALMPLHKASSSIQHVASCGIQFSQVKLLSFFCLFHLHARNLQLPVFTQTNGSST